MGLWDWLRGLFKELRVTSEGDGKTSPSGTSWWFKGTKVKLWAFPDKDREFVNWKGDLSGTANPMDVVMMANKVIQAIFTRIMNTLTITIVGNGTVAKSPDAPEYVPGTSVTLTATPAAGWRFENWVVDGAVVSTNPTIVVA